MESTGKQALRAFVKETLESHGDRKEFLDGESLFISGRLDSVAMMNVVMYLEETFAVDFSNFEFDVELLDTLDAIVALVDAKVVG